MACLVEVVILRKRHRRAREVIARIRMNSSKAAAGRKEHIASKQASGNTKLATDHAEGTRETVGRKLSWLNAHASPTQA